MSNRQMSEYHSMKLGRVEGMARRNKEDIAGLDKTDKEITRRIDALDRKLVWLIIAVIIQILLSLKDVEASKFLLGLLKAAL